MLLLWFSVGVLISISKCIVPVLIASSLLRCIFHQFVCPNAHLVRNLESCSRLHRMCPLCMPLNENSQQQGIGITELTASSKLDSCFMWKLLTNKHNLIIFQDIMYITTTSLMMNLAVCFKFHDR